MSQGFTDWEDLGIFPLQDTEDGVPLGMRMALVGGRVAKRPEAGENGQSTVTEYAREDGLGTLGDVHPWFFWQTKEREKRAMGSWSMAWGAIVTDSASAYYGGGAGVQPITRNGRAVVNDNRYRVVEPAWSKAMPWQPEGMLAMVMPSTDEVNPSSVMLNGDRRLVASNVEGPGQAGTTIVDMQPAGVLCMGQSDTPGQGGRHARLQALVRVIALGGNAGGTLGGASGGFNSIALNYGVSQQEGIMGYGMIYGPAVAGGGSGGGGPVTEGGSSSGTGPITGQTGPVRPGGPEGPGPSGPGAPPPPSNPGPDFAGPGGGALGADGGEGPNASDQVAISDFGSFMSKAQPGHAIGLMSGGASGPIVFGCGKHVVGFDNDGHRMTSAHLSTDAYFFNSGSRDGPLMFEGKFPDAPAEHSIPTLVHLSWDEKQNHNFLGGSRAGKWRWWTTVPYVESEEEEEGGETPGPGGTANPSGPSSPSSPTGPTTPGAGQPNGPSPPNAPGTPGAPTGPNAPGGSSPRGPIRPGRPVSPPRGPIRPGGPPGNAGGPIRPGSPPPPPNPPWESPLKPRGPIRPGGPVRPGSGPLINAPGTPEYLTGNTHYSQRPTTDYPVPPGGSVFSGRGTEYQELELEPTSDTNQERGGPAGVINKVGGSARGRDVGLYSILHPFNTGFSAISLRPQLWIKGAPNFEHNPLLSARAYRAEEKTRPSTVTIRAWGAQNESGEWDYLENPKQSRARGGIVNGGLLISPAEFEMEDYLGIGSAEDTDSPTAAAYLTVAPKVIVAFGKPSTYGRPTISSKLIHQETAEGPLIIASVDNTEAGAIAGDTDDIAHLSVVSNQGYLDLKGTGAMKLPVGTTAQQPGAPTEGDFRYNSSDSAIEYYDGSAWVQPGGGTVNQDKAPNIQLSQGPGNYTTERTLAKWEPRAGDITDANLNVSRGITADANRYWIFRIYRAASVVATISTDTTTITANTLQSFGTLSNESYDGTQAVSLTVQSVNDGTQPISLNGHYLTFDIKHGVD